MTPALELKSFSCHSIERIDQWLPTDNIVTYQLDLTIGFKNDDWGGNYRVIVATPNGLLANLEANNFIFDIFHKFIILHDYCWDIVIAIINEKLANIEIYDFYDWLDINEQLLQHFNASYTDVHGV